MASGRPRHAEDIDLTGHRFGALTVLGLAPRVNAVTRWECECDCGTRLAVTQGRLLDGLVLTCGCGWLPDGTHRDPDTGLITRDERYAREFTSARPTLRKCHDCGASTPDYRCARCRAKWRTKHHVRPVDVEQGDLW